MKMLSLFRRTSCCTLVVALLFAGVQRLPAPISEIETPTPTPKQSAKPKPKFPPKPKPKPEASASATSSAKQPAAKQSRFAGAWVGTIQTFPPGNTDTVLTVDSTETTMTLTWSLGKSLVEKTRITGDTMQATFSPGTIYAATFSLTPQTDGVTANVRLQAFLNDFTAVFHRPSNANGIKTAK